MASAASRRHHDVVSLFWRVFAINAVVLVAAVAVLALSPATVSSRIHAGELAVLAIGLAVVLAVNLVALRRVFGPLERLTSLMRRVDPLASGRRIVVERQAAGLGGRRDLPRVRLGHARGLPPGAGAADRPGLTGAPRARLPYPRRPGRAWLCA